MWNLIPKMMAKRQKLPREEKFLSKYMSCLKLRKVSKIIEYHGHFSICKSGKDHDCTYLKASEVAELMKIDNWRCCKEEWKEEWKWVDGRWKMIGWKMKYSYVTKKQVTFVVTKSNAHYSESDMFKRKTDWLYVECDKDYKIDHMGGGHRG